MIRTVLPDDAKQIAEIYNYYVINTTVTFEEEMVPENVMKERIVHLHKKYPWLVYEEEGKIIGYAFAGPWKERAAYRHSVEISIYLRNEAKGKGMGTALYSELFSKLKALNFHSLIGGIALPNEECIALHKKFGFEPVAHFKEVGFKFQQWIDVIYYQKISEISNRI